MSNPLNPLDDVCPGGTELSAFASGMLHDAAIRDFISAHLETCEKCVSILAGNRLLDPFVASLQRAAEDAASHSGSQFADPGFQAVLDRVLKIGIESSVHANRLTHNEALGTISESFSDPAIDEETSDKKMGPYQLLGKIGAGGMGEVFHGFHTQMQRHVAIKLLPKDRIGDDRARKRFQREMQTIGKLSHPNIVVGYDAGEMGGHCYLVMELLDGMDLETLVSLMDSPIPVADACELVCRTAIALKYAHKHGIVHRDVKPSNIMLCVDYSLDSIEQPEHGHGATVKLLDLGLARIEQPHDASGSMTAENQIMGTIDYMSPEQLVDSSDADVRSDVYSLGATLFFLLAGKSPWKVAGYKTQRQKIKGLLFDALPSINSIRTDLPKRLVQVVERSLKRDPNDRFQSVREMIVALKPYTKKQHLALLLEHAKSALKSRNHGDHIHQDFASFIGDVAANSSNIRQPAADWELSETQQEIMSKLFEKPVSKRPRFATGLWLVLLILPITAIVASIIWLRTDGGYIRIEADPTIDVTVELLANGKQIDQISISSDQLSRWCRSGDYEIRIPADQQSKLTVEGGEFTLSRGESPLVRITKVSAED